MYAMVDYNINKQVFTFKITRFKRFQHFLTHDGAVAFVFVSRMTRDPVLNPREADPLPLCSCATRAAMVCKLLRTILP